MRIYQRSVHALFGAAAPRHLKSFVRVCIAVYMATRCRMSIVWGALLESNWYALRVD